MIELRFQDGDASRIIGELVGRETERCAVLLGIPRCSARDWTVLSSPASSFPTMITIQTDRSLVRSSKPDYIAQIGKVAARENLSAIFVHSHPGSAPPEFSRTDDDGETHLARFLSVRAPDTGMAPWWSALAGWCARCLGEKTPMRVVSVGAAICKCYSTPWLAQVPRR